MGYMYKNSKGVTYYLHTRGGKLFYFSKEEAGSVDLPEGMVVVENPKTGLPMVKRKA